jgi:chromate transport protein ChrA
MKAHPQLFLHVLAAIVLFGSVAAATLLAWSGRVVNGQASTLAGAAFRALLAFALPAWVVMFIFGNWTKSKEHIPDATHWLKIGSAIAIAGVLVLLASIGSSFAWSRTPTRRGLATVTGALTTLLLLALAVAWWVMTAKVPS